MLLHLQIAFQPHCMSIGTFYNKYFPQIILSRHFCSSIKTKKMDHQKILGKPLCFVVVQPEAQGWLCHISTSNGTTQVSPTILYLFQYLNIRYHYTGRTLFIDKTWLHRSSILTKITILKLLNTDFIFNLCFPWLSMTHSCRHQGKFL